MLVCLLVPKPDSSLCLQGEWKCVASNDYGHSVTATSVKLVVPRHYKKPVFLEPLQAVLSQEGTVNLECKVMASSPVLALLLSFLLFPMIACSTKIKNCESFCASAGQGAHHHLHHYHHLIYVLVQWESCSGRFFYAIYHLLPCYFTWP